MEYWPASQAVQLLEFVAPTLAEYCPVSQALQLLAPLVEYRPASQAAQLASERPRQRPAAQSAQVRFEVSPALVAWPAAQRVQRYHVRGTTVA